MKTRLVGGRYMTRLLQLVLGMVFVVAGGLKVVNPAQFAVAVGHYRLLPPGLDNLMALTLPGVEVLAGGLLLAGIWRRAAALVIAGLTVIFLGAIISALARGLNIECGCFGTVNGANWLGESGAGCNFVEPVSLAGLAFAEGFNDVNFPQWHG